MNIRQILGTFQKIAVLGMSPNPDRASHYVSEYMLEQGYDVVGVNPGHREILGRPVYPRLSEVPGPLEIVAVFRSSEHLPRVVDEAIELKPRVLWIQLGIEDADAEARAEKAGITVVRRRCLMVEHRALTPE